jgi:hypothetical protein
MAWRKEKYFKRWIRLYVVCGYVIKEVSFLWGPLSLPLTTRKYKHGWSWLKWASSRHHSGGASVFTGQTAVIDLRCSVNWMFLFLLLALKFCKLEISCFPYSQFWNFIGLWHGIENLWWCVRPSVHRDQIKNIISQNKDSFINKKVAFIF